MAETTLHALRINHGQTEVAYEPARQSRTFATNLVISAARTHLSAEAAKDFYFKLHLGGYGQSCLEDASKPVTLTGDEAAAIAKDLGF